MVIGRLLARLRRRCSCDPRFVGVAHDLDCPVHGLAAEVGSRGRA